MPAVALVPSPMMQFQHGGAPLAGGLLFTYTAGSFASQPTYTDATGSTPNDNPVVLDSDGKASVWLNAELSYKFILAASDDPTHTYPLWSVDNITPSPNIADIQANVFNVAVDAGGVNAFSINLSPRPPTLEQGMSIAFQAANANTGACTLNVNGTGAVPFKANLLGQPFSGGEIPAGAVVIATYVNNSTMGSPYWAWSNSYSAASLPSNVVTAPKTIPTDTSLVLASYVVVDSNLIVDGNLILVG